MYFLNVNVPVYLDCQDGVHQCEDGIPAYTADQLMLMQSQDMKYVNYKQSINRKVGILACF